MLLIFTLRRQDILPVGDLGVQKGLLRWVLAAHGELPPSTPKTPKTPKSPKGTPKKRTANSTPLTATPLPSQASQTTEIDLSSSQRTETTDVKRSSTPPPTLTPSKPPATPSNFPSTPGPPPVTPSASTNPMLPPKAPDSILATPEGWDHICAYRAAPLPPGLSLNELKARLAGKKAKYVSHPPLQADCFLEAAFIFFPQRWKRSPMLGDLTALSPPVTPGPWQERTRFIDYSRRCTSAFLHRCTA